MLDFFECHPFEKIFMKTVPVGKEKVFPYLEKELEDYAELNNLSDGIYSSIWYSLPK
jgi:hypothetical protein